MSQGEQASEEKNSSVSAQPVLLGSLALLGINAAVIYGCLNLLSWEFTYNSVFVERPLIVVLMLFAAAFVGYVAAIVVAKRVSQNGMLIGVIIGFALLFRVVMVFSYPIQEVDIYRYMWDGEVQTQGVSPFKFSPEEVLSAVTEAEKLDLNQGEGPTERSPDEGNDEAENPDLKKLVVLCGSDPSVKEVLRRVHFKELPTIYPPTSQLVFRVASMITPKGEWTREIEDPELQRVAIERAVDIRLWGMKTILVSFDMGVLLLLIGILVLCRMPVGLSVAYGWCPLVMKEVANGGHLDAIAVFLSVLAMFLLVCLVYRSASSITRDDRSYGSLLLAVFAALVLAAAVGAKLYPIVLAPLVFIGIARRCSWLTTGLATIAFVAAAVLLVRPMLPSSEVSQMDSERAAAAQAVADAADQLAAAEQLSAVEQLAAAQQLPAVKQLMELRQRVQAGEAPPKDFEDDPSAGLTKFLKTWEMNDFIFMIAVENLKVDPTDEVNLNKLPIWFSIVPQGLRRLIVNPVLKEDELRLKELNKRFEKIQNRLATARHQIASLAGVENAERKIAEREIAEREIAEREIAAVKASIYQMEAERVWRQVTDVKADISGTPFKITRALTSFVFLLVAVWFAWRAGAKAGASDGLGAGRFYCEAAFLTLAWFWLIIPTQNPWYWLWALPFLPFMRNRAWFAVSGVILIYYFRFWMEYHFTGVSVWGTPYQGVAFFDFVLTWFEFAPLLIWLAVEGLVWLFIDSARHRRSGGESMVEATPTAN